MAKSIKRKCVQCGKLEFLNKSTNLCVTCAVKRSAENARQLRERKGPYFDKWKKNLILFLQETK